jgi:hypothetical protein
MTHECPACEQEASKKITLSMGDGWADTFGKPPHSLFSKYVMVHVGEQQQGSLVVYCHTQTDLQGRY